MSNDVEKGEKTKAMLCYHCGRFIWEDPRRT